MNPISFEILQGTNTLAYLANLEATKKKKCCKYGSNTLAYFASPSEIKKALQLWNEMCNTSYFNSDFGKKRKNNEKNLKF
jgi:hypothetical protein